MNKDLFESEDIEEVENKIQSYRNDKNVFNLLRGVFEQYQDLSRVSKTAVNIELLLALYLIISLLGFLPYF
jgi:hypothetical protein